MTGRSCHHHGPCPNTSTILVGISDGPGMQTHDCCGNHEHVLYSDMDRDQVAGIMHGDSYEGLDPVARTEVDAVTTKSEKHYMVCETCGEAFDEIGYAMEHESRCGDNLSYEVKPESEAL